MNYFALVAIAWGVIAPLATWGLTEGKYRLIEIPNARAAAAREATDAEHERATEACNARVEGIRQQIAAASEEARKLAEEAEASMQATPEEKAARQAMCDADGMCRARKGN
jgi:hypothetical protein